MNYYGSGANTQGAFVNPVLVPAGTTGSLFTLGRGAYAGNITVHGTLNLTTSYIRSQPTGDWSASDGQINIAAGTGGGDLYYNTAANISYGTAAVDLGAGARIYNAGNTGTAGNTFTIGELTGFGTITDSSSGGGTNRITTYLVGGRNSSATFSGTIANLARQTAINKVGTGSWTLNGTDTYTGPTTVSGGVLVVSPSSYMANCTNITVAAGALFDVSQFNGLIMTAGQTLAGSGVVTGSVAMVASDVLAPGGGVAGTLSFSNSLALTGEVTHAFDLSKSPLGSNDLVVVQGDLGLANTNSLLLNALNGYLTSGVYPLIRYHGNVTNETGAVVPVGVLTSLKPVGLWATQSHATLIVSNAPGQIVLVVDVGTGTSLTWAGDGYTNTWDLTVSTNWLQAATPVAFFQYDRVTFGDPTTNTAVSVVGTLAPTAVTVNSASNYTFSGSGKLTGLTGLTKTGNGTLTVGNTGGNDYAGPVTIPAGVLKAGVATALGATNGATLITNTGALDVGGLSLANEPIIVSGSGSGTGAILNSGAAQLSALQCVTLAGDTTFGGTNRWDIRTNALGAYLHGNGHNLTKTSSNDIYFVSLGATDLGDIAVQQGRIGVQDTTLLGAGGTLRLSAGAGLDLWNNSVTNTKAVSLTNATLSSSSGTNAYGGPIDLNGTGTFTATTPLVLSGALGGTGGLLKNGASPLTLTGTNTYTGTTTVSVATLALAGTGSIGRSAVIDVAAAAALDVSGLAGGWVTLGSGQTLMGSGSVRGSVIAPVGATVAPGEAIGTLTVTNTVTLAGNTLMELNTTNPQSSDRLTATNIGYGGTLTLTNLGPALAAGNAFKLFSGAYSGAFATINPPTPGPGLAWFNTLGSDGTLAVVSATPPTILPVYLVGTNLALRIETVVGKNYVLEGTPGLEGTPVWTPVGTNAGTGLVSTNLVPVNSTGGRGFFRYQVQ
jgi:autotransporter-associated beta strand protein